MGYARIVSGGTDGRYVIELDYGESSRVALVAGLGSLLAKLEVDLGTALADLAEAEEEEAAKLLQLQQAQAAYIAEANALPPGSPLPDSKPWEFLQAEYLRLRAQSEPLRLKIAALKVEISATSKERARFEALQTLEQRSAWCTTLTEDLAPGQYPATLEIPGESALILIAPNGRAWTPFDGRLRAREIMSPEQAYFNAAILPGWQKDKPTYRWGTITAINIDADTADVSLAAATSSAQDLNINPSSTLSAVPVVYMTCNAEAFEVGDHVVVQFLGQDWSDPRVIGFLDNPRPCLTWPPVYVLVGETVTWQARTGAGLPHIRVIINSSCGPLAVSVVHITVLGPSATHTMRRYAPRFANPQPLGFTIVPLTDASEADVYSASSTLMPAGVTGMPPSAGEWYETTFERSGPQTAEARFFVEQETRTFALETVPLLYDGFCTVLSQVVGLTSTQAVPSTVLDDLASTVLQAPTLKVTKGSQEKNYAISEVNVSQTYEDSNNSRRDLINFTFVYRPVEA